MVGLAKDRGIRKVYVPAEDAPEAALIDGMEVLPVKTLRELVLHLNGHPLAAGLIVPYVLGPQEDDGVEEGQYPVDMSHIKGQEHVKRALEVAASGGTIYL